MPSGVYNNSAKILSTFDFLADDLRVMLLKSSYVFNADHDLVSDLVPASNELADASYARKTLAGKTLTIDDANDRGKFTFNNVIWTALAGGEVVAAAAFFKFVTGDGDSVPLFYQAINPARTTNGEDFKLIPNSVGFVLVTGEVISLASSGVLAFGQATLSAGSAVINHAVAGTPGTSYIIHLTQRADENVWVDAAVANSFTIKSSNGASTAQVMWSIEAA